MHKTRQYIHDLIVGYNIRAKFKDAQTKYPERGRFLRSFFVPKAVDGIKGVPCKIVGV